MPPLDLIQLSSSQLERLPRDQTVFFLPVGPIEDHGPHLPLGLDLMEAGRLSWLAAQKLETEMPGWVGVLLPSAPLGLEFNTSRMGVKVRPHVLRDWLVDSCRSLMRLGFVHFVCFSGHLGPRQLTAIEDAGKLIRKFSPWKALLFKQRGKRGIPTLISASSALVSPQDVWKSPFWPDPVEHAGKRDTSVALAIAPNSVDPIYKNLIQKNRESSALKRMMNRFRHKTEGYWGAPLEAEASQGEAILQEQLDQLFPKMKMIWEGASPASLFRSWYSILPPNKSFYRVWLLLFAILLILSGWVYLCFMLLPMSLK